MTTSVAASMCTVATFDYRFELGLLVSSFRQYCEKPIFVACDKATKIWIEDKYSGKDIECFSILDEMIPDMNVLADSSRPEFRPAFKQLLLAKTLIMEEALGRHKSTLYADSDIVFLGCPENIDLSESEVALSAHDIGFEVDLQCGIYNAGYVATSNVEFSRWWREEQQKEDKFDQLCLEKAPKNFRCSRIGGSHNIGWWKTYHGPRGLERLNSISCDKDTIFFDGRPMISVHTHLVNFCWYKNSHSVVADFNKKFMSVLEQSQSQSHQILGSLIADYRNQYTESGRK